MEKNLPRKSNSEVDTGEAKIRTAEEEVGVAGKTTNNLRGTNLSKG
jgi:hypothetical protein